MDIHPPSRALAPWMTPVVVAMALACGSASAPKNTALSRTSHELYFSIATGSHATLDCNACHGAVDSFRQYQCTGCHDHDGPTTDAAHRGITPAYLFTPTSCYQCHAPGTNLLFNHLPYFPIRAGDKHAAIACVNCHTDPAQRTQQDCLTCHPSTPVDGQHVDVGGYVRDSAQCRACHADSQVKTVASHLPFTLEAPFKHHLTPCAGCHTTHRSDKPFGIEFNAFSCLDCHAQSVLAPTHTPLPSYKYESPTCVQSGCHSQGQKLQ